MNALAKIRDIQVRAGLHIINIGDARPDAHLHNTIQVTAEGEVFLVDVCGVVQKINTSMAPIEVQIGTPEADQLGFLNGNTTLRKASFARSYLEIFIGNINVYSIDRHDGTPYFEKAYDSDIVILHGMSLSTYDVVKIKYL